ncbi:MAG: methyltransferase domain-containing protein [Myxococcota bacterium]
MRFRVGAFETFFHAYDLLYRVAGGIALGFFDAADLQDFNTRAYAKTRMYQSADHNEQGLYDWEKACFERYFPKQGRILAIGVGGGREVLALRRMGYTVSAFECNPVLVESANALMRKHHLDEDIALGPKDACPSVSGPFDGMLVGWGAYSHIFSSATRVQLLRDVADILEPNAPILLSTPTRDPSVLYNRRLLTLANAIRHLRRQAPVQQGDTFNSMYLHFFTQAELESELDAGGFTPAFFSAHPYGHAVGRVRAR